MSQHQFSLELIQRNVNGGVIGQRTTDGYINATKYTQILEEHLLPSIPDDARYRFQHDNAAPHTATHTSQWLMEYGVNMLDDWPPYSPDLNPIERVWAWMARYVNKMRPTNRAELVHAILEAWDEIPQRVIQAFITGMPFKLPKIEEAGGSLVY